jgi:hypothetical protein
MALPDPVADPLQLALGVLKPLPCQVFVVAASRAGVRMTVCGTDGANLVCMPADGPTVGHQVTVVVSDGRRVGYEIDCRVVADQDPDAVLLHPEELRRVTPRRRHARASVSESGLVQPEGEGSELDVQVIDVGPDGVAFMCDQPLVLGDVVSGVLHVARRSFPIRARVMHMRPAGLGRVQVGCQLITITNHDRELLRRIARQAPADRRRPRPLELVEPSATLAHEPAVLVESTACHDNHLRVPTVRYCRACARITLQHDAAPPGHSAQWRCFACSTGHDHTNQEDRKYR